MSYNLYIKTINLLTFGQQKKNNSMLIKKFCNSKLRVILPMIRLTNSFYNQSGGIKVPIVRNNKVLSGKSFYVIRFLQEWSSTQKLSKIFKIEENLKVIINGRRKNSGNPESRKTGGFGGIVVRSMSSSTYIRKGPSSKATLDFKLSGYKSVEVGLNNIDKQVLDYIKTGRRVRGLSKLLQNPEFLLFSYSKIRFNQSTTTLKLSNITVDATKLEYFEKIATSVVNGSYTFEFVKRKCRSKVEDGQNSFVISNLRDSIIQEALRQLLELVYERIFSDVSHGFRPNRNCYTALNQVQMTMDYSPWFIEGTILQYCNPLNSNHFLFKLTKVIQDQPFIDLVHKAFKAGYGLSSRDNICNSTGFFQDGVLGPILANIYLHDFDLNVLQLAEFFNKSLYRQANTKSVELKKNQFVYLKIHNNSHYKIMKYVRYGDSFFLGITGSKADCEWIKSEMDQILKNKFQLQLNLKKTKITNAKQDSAFFLGYYIRRASLMKSKRYLFSKAEKSPVKLTSSLLLYAPIDKIQLKLHFTGYCKLNGNPTRAGKFVHESLTKIICKYKSLQNELLAHYFMANNYERLFAKIYYILKYSCALTIASKMKLGTLKKVFNFYGANLEIKNEQGKVIQSYPKISYIRLSDYTKVKNPNCTSRLPMHFKKRLFIFDSACIICGTLDTTKVYHVDKLKKTTTKSSSILHRVKTSSKQIFVCQCCHQFIQESK
uniref:Domain X domain-containing protein n=1 Tax=Pyropia kanakaensis TaxID=139729 RepID=A0A060DDJ7_9RHOD|nr:hypothetical protein GU34_p14 [Pyropia kanakaensis]AIB08207.1 hypothetical protein [Pyropia kanakaensis]